VPTVNEAEAQKMPVKVVVVCGSPGAGKTTLAPHICAALGGAALIDKDTLEWPLANACLANAGLQPHALESELYTSVLKPAAYETMERMAEQNVAAGNSVVLVAPYTAHVQDNTWVQQLSERMRGAPVYLVWVTASAATLRERKASRASARDATELKNPAFFAAADSKRKPPIVPHVLVDTSGVALNAMAALSQQLVAPELRGATPAPEV
jgi:predicted kinase